MSMTDYKKCCFWSSVVLILFGVSKSTLVLEYGYDIFFIASITFSVLATIVIGVVGIVSARLEDKHLSTGWIALLIYLLVSIAARPLFSLLFHMLVYDIERFKSSFKFFVVASDILQIFIVLAILPFAIKFRRSILKKLESSRTVQV